MPVFPRKTVILDLGASRVALGVFSRTNGRLCLDDYAMEIFPGQTGGENDWLEQTREALAVLRNRSRAGTRVVVVLPPHLTLAKLIKTPRVEAAQREKILRFEAEQSIPYAPAEMVWDTVVAAETEAEQEVLLVAAKREAIEMICGLIQMAGFEPRLMLPSSLATMAAFRLRHGTPPEPTIILNLGARSSTLLQVTDQRFRVRSLALGTRNLVWKTAEEQDHVALEMIATRLVQEIARSVVHFRREGGMESPVRVWLTGGGARLIGLEAALAAKLKVPVGRLDLIASMVIGRGLAQNDRAGGASTLADLIGAAATQLRTGQPVLNLLPSSLRRQANRRRRIGLAATALVAAALWLTVGYLRPVLEPVRVTASKPHEPGPRMAESFTPSSEPIHIGEGNPYDLELIEVKTVPFPLQLAGYFGEPGDYGVVFICPGQPEPWLVRPGHQFEPLGFTLRSFEVRKVAVPHDDPWPVYEVAGFAVLHDEKAGTEVVLDSRRRPTGTLQAVLRTAPDRPTSTWREGELIVHGGGTFRIQRIQADPPEVVLVPQAAGLALVLQPVRPANDPGGQSVWPETASVPDDL